MSEVELLKILRELQKWQTSAGLAEIGLFLGTPCGITYNKDVGVVLIVSPPAAGAVVLGANMFPIAWNAGLLCDG